MWIFDAINIFSKGIITMADSNADKIAQIKAFEEQQAANAAKQRDLRSKAYSLPEGAERDALLAQREQLRQENKDIESRIQQVAPDSASDAIYEGPDRNSGQQVYVNPVTGKRFVSSEPPTDSQKSNSLPFDGEQSDKARETAIADDNKAAQQGYAGYPEPAADKPANEDPAAPMEQETVDSEPLPAAEETQTYADYDIPPAVSSDEDTEAARADLMNDIDAAQDANLRELLGQNDNVASSIMGSVDQVRSSPTRNAPRNQRQKDDWRIRLSLAPSAKYLYKNPNIKVSDLLYPLTGTDGVIFPYMPQINSSYKANYDPSDLTHSNFKTFFYKNSSVEEIQIVADFTAQDSSEANYMLAVIHFFKSVTKMFYGQDGKNGGPRSGTPPPLCYLNGLGTYQFNDHPVLVSSFTYSLPNDVDYIRAGASAAIAGQNTDSTSTKQSSGFSFDLSSIRAKISGLTKGSISNEPQFNSLSKANATYVPTKIQITLGLLPVVTRNDMSKNFSLEDYATGKLLKGSERNGRGIW